MIFSPQEPVAFGSNFCDFFFFKRSMKKRWGLRGHHAPEKNKNKNKNIKFRNTL